MSEDVVSAPDTSTPETSAPVEAPQSVDAALDSFSARMMAEESVAAETPETPVVPDGEAPTIEEPPPDQTASDPSKQGPIPFAAHKQALENARLKAAEETQQRLVQEWQTQVAPVLPYVNAIAQDAQNGSIDGLTSLIAEYAKNPQLGPQIRSFFGRMLSMQRGQAQTPPADARPEPDLQTADGALVYSAQQQQALEEWRDRQWQQRLQQTIQPFQQQHEQTVQQQRVQQAQSQAMQWATQQLTEFRADPDFPAHEAIVKERMAANPSLSLDRAWQQVYRDVVVPKKLAMGNQQYLEAAAKKSRGSSPDPAASAPAHPRRARTEDEALDQVFDQYLASR